MHFKNEMVVSDMKYNLILFESYFQKFYIRGRVEVKNFNRFICAGLIVFAGLLSVCGVSRGAEQSQNGIGFNNYDTNWTRGEYALFYNAYPMNSSSGEDFTGSSTLNGGTSTFSSGCINVSHLSGTKYFSAYFSPTTAGSCTVNIYGVFGTTTVGAGTSAAALLMSPYIFAGTTATSTTFTITQNPMLIAVSVNCTSGTVSPTIGMNSTTSR